MLLHTNFHQTMMTEHLRVALPLADKEAVAAAAHRQGVTVAGFVRNAVADALARDGAPHRRDAARHPAAAENR
ncbi:hypothetical protein LRS73_18020 [Methylobacterium currus]|uniref:hypothetical protein n=1 Tax=Methylobacterium currus TaxID=2051553 RepID=UPI001E5E7FF6|nr:hypothetical protein [Methylobacterium currus]UHC14445.1 hypothetical protein LRS73_18020 [Methylobacterium currus]